MALGAITGTRTIASSPDPRAGREERNAMPPDPAPLVRRVADKQANGEWLLQGNDGQALRLVVAGVSPAGLTPGQALLVRVIATQPQLELEILGAAPATANPTAVSSDTQWHAETGALQLDQAALRRITSPPIDAAAHALTWRTQVLEQLRQGSTLQEGRLAHAHAEADPGQAARSPNVQNPPQAILAIHVLAWSGTPLHLEVFDEGRAEAQKFRKLWGRGIRLCICLALPDIGPLRIHVECIHRNVSLMLEATTPSAVQRVRKKVSLIHLMLSNAHLRLVRCHVGQADFKASWQPTSPPGTTLSAETMPLNLFRAASETVAAFSPPFQ